MTTDLAPIKTDDEVITTLIASHGDVDLAAERLFGPEPGNKLTLLKRLPSLNLTAIVEGLKVARLLKTYDAFAITLETVVTDLPDLPVQQRSRFLTDLMDRLEVMMNPPVHGGSGQAGNQFLTFVNGLNPEDARGKLLDNLIKANSASLSPEQFETPPSSASLGGAGEDDSGVTIRDRFGANV